MPVFGPQVFEGRCSVRRAACSGHSAVLGTSMMCPCEFSLHRTAFVSYLADPHDARVRAWLCRNSTSAPSP